MLNNFIFSKSFNLILCMAQVIDYAISTKIFIFFFTKIKYLFVLMRLTYNKCSFARNLLFSYLQNTNWTLLFALHFYCFVTHQTYFMFAVGHWYKWILLKTYFDFTVYILAIILISHFNKIK